MQRVVLPAAAAAPLGPDAIARAARRPARRRSVACGPAGTCIHARTGGNPFFTEEVVQSLIECRAARRERGRLPARAAPSTTLEMPADRAGGARARIDRLPRAREARAADRGGDRQGLSRAGAARASRSSPRSISPRRLRALRCAEFIHETALYPVAEYAFKHPLTQEVALRLAARERAGAAARRRGARARPS